MLLQKALWNIGNGTMTTKNKLFCLNEGENVILEKTLYSKSCWKFDFTLFKGLIWSDMLRFGRKILDRKTHYYPRTRNLPKNALLAPITSTIQGVTDQKGDDKDLNIANSWFCNIWSSKKHMDRWKLNLWKLDTYWWAGML